MKFSFSYDHMNIGPSHMIVLTLEPRKVGCFEHIVQFHCNTCESFEEFFVDCKAFSYRVSKFDKNHVRAHIPHR